MHYTYYATEITEYRRSSFIVLKPVFLYVLGDLCGEKFFSSCLVLYLSLFTCNFELSTSSFNTVGLFE